MGRRRAAHVSALAARRALREPGARRANLHPNPNPNPSPNPNPIPNPNPNPNPNPTPNSNPNPSPNPSPTPNQALAAAARAGEAARRGEEVAGHVPLSYRGKSANRRASEGSSFSGVGAYCQATDAGVSTLCGASYER